jgi:predicted secreted protein
MSNSFSGQGSQLQVGDGVIGSESFTTVAEVKNIQRTGSKSDQVDVTNMDSVGAYREYLPTLLDAGEISFTGNYIPADATQQNLQTLFDNRTKRNCKIVLPNSLGHWAFAAYIAGLDFDLSVDKEATISVKLKVTGKPVFTAGS